MPFTKEDAQAFHDGIKEFAELCAEMDIRIPRLDTTLDDLGKLLADTTTDDARIDDLMNQAIAQLAAFGAQRPTTTEDTTMTFPTLEAIQSRPYRAAALLLSTGETRTVLKSERVIFAPDLNLLTVGSDAYRVPAHLIESTRRALSVGRVHL